MMNGWKIVNAKSNSYNSDELLRVRPECKLRVRLIGQPVKYVRLFTKNKKSIVVDSENVSHELKQKHPHIIGNVSVRFACWCIDRATNTMKILDMPRSIARTLGSREEIIKKKISGSKEGCDWGIGTNGKTGKDVRYIAAYLEETPLTEEEIQMVKDRKADKDSYDLIKVFKSHSLEEAEEKLLK